MRRKRLLRRESSLVEFLLVLAAYIGIYAGLGYAFASQSDKAREITVSEVPRLLAYNISFNLAVFCGVALFLMLAFHGLKLAPLTLSEKTVLESVMAISIVVLLMVVANSTITNLLSQAGMTPVEDPAILALREYFSSPWLVLLVGAPVMFLMAGLPEEVMRSYVLSSALRMNSSGLATLGAIVTAAAFAFGHFYQGAIGVAVMFVIGLLLAFFYLIRKSFWNLVLAHTAYNIVALLLPTLTHKP